MRLREFTKAAARVVAVVVVTLSTPATSNAQVVCDAFRKRLTTAGTVLDFDTPRPKFERAPAQDDDHWWISYSTLGVPVSDVEADMSCRDGRFQDFELFDYTIDTPITGFSHPQTYHLLAAAVYAYTGWEPRKVLRSLYALLTATTDEGDAGIVHLPNGVVARLWINTKTTGTAHLIIESE
jgi:hypothetical protein